MSETDPQRTHLNFEGSVAVAALQNIVALYPVVYCFFVTNK